MKSQKERHDKDVAFWKAFGSKAYEMVYDIPRTAIYKLEIGKAMTASASLFRETKKQSISCPEVLERTIILYEKSTSDYEKVYWFKRFYDIVSSIKHYIDTDVALKRFFKIKFNSLEALPPMHRYFVHSLISLPLFVLTATSPLLFEWLMHTSITTICNILLAVEFLLLFAHALILRIRFPSLFKKSSPRKKS